MPDEAEGLWDKALVALTDWLVGSLSSELGDVIDSQKAAALDLQAIIWVMWQKELIAEADWNAVHVVRGSWKIRISGTVALSVYPGHPERMCFLIYHVLELAHPLAQVQKCPHSKRGSMIYRECQGWKEKKFLT